MNINITSVDHLNIGEGGRKGKREGGKDVFGLKIAKRN